MQVKYIRFKVIGIVIAVSVFLAAGMWVYNSLFIIRNTAALTNGLSFFLPSVCGLAALAGFFINLMLNPLVTCLKKASRQGAADQDRQQAALAIVRLPLVIIIANIAGFLLGPVLNIILPDLISRGMIVFETRDLLTVFANVCTGMVSSLLTILLINIVLAPCKELLGIRTFQTLAGGKDISLRTKNILLPLSLVLMTAAMVGLAGYNAYCEIVRYPLAVYERVYNARETDGAARHQLTEAERTYLGNLVTVLQSSLQTEESPELLPSVESLRSAFGQQQQGLLGSLILLFGLLLGISLLVTLFYASEHLYQLKSVTGQMEDLLKGKRALTSRFNIIHFDEMGRLVSNLNGFLDYLNQLIEDVKTAANEVTGASAAINMFITSLLTVAGNLSQGIKQVTSNTMNQGRIIAIARTVIEEMLQMINTVSGNVDKQAGFVEESSASIMEMDSNLDSITGIVKDANSLSIQLETVARKGEDEVENTVESMQVIKLAAENVSEVVEAISGMASQTNLLSMNAAIEASHAGDLGRGFGVVAEEIRKLAEESNESAASIFSHIKQMNSNIKSGVSISEHTGQAFNEIYKSILRNKELMATIDTAITEQGQVVKNLFQSIITVTATTQRVKDLTGSQRQKNQDVYQSLDELSRSMEKMNTAVKVQVEGSNELNKAIKKVEEISTTNAHVVSRLAAAIARFESKSTGD